MKISTPNLAIILFLPLKNKHQKKKKCMGKFFSPIDINRTL
jgi:hypothetical protein